jgi:hypothetical protein
MAVKGAVSNCTRATAAHRITSKSTLQAEHWNLPQPLSALPVLSSFSGFAISLGPGPWPASPTAAGASLPWHLGLDIGFV